MTTKRPIAKYLSALALLAVLLPARLDAAAPGPKWLSGFPLRAGESIILMWTPLPGATGYRLLRQTGDAPPKEIYKGPLNTFNDTTAQSSETVTYQIVGILADGDSEISAPGIIRGIAPMVAPNFTGALGTASVITLRWTAPPGTMFTNVYRSETENGEYALLESVQLETYTDRKAAKGKPYFYQVSAVGKSGKESPRSPAIRASLREMKNADSAEEKPVVRKVTAVGSFKGEELYALNQPSFTGFTSTGELYVVERGGIQFFDRDGGYLNRIRFDRKWALPGGPVEDSAGNFYVPFYAEQVIRRVDRTGKPVGELRYPPWIDNTAGRIRKTLRPAAASRRDGTAAAEAADEAIKPLRFPNNPNQVVIDGTGHFWVLDGVRAQVIKLNAKGEELAVIGRPPGTYEEKEMTPADLPTAKGIQYNPYDRKLYVILGVTAQIKVIDPETATVVATFGGVGTGTSKFQGIGGLAFRKNGNILVLDHLMQVVKEFNPKYGYVATYADKVERNSAVLTSNLLANFAFDEKGQRLYVTSTMGNRVYKFDVVPE
jgi:sugar lactone lactonase YvrE